MAQGDRDAEDAKVNRWRSGQLVQFRRRSERHRSIGHWQREKTTAVTSTHRDPVVYMYQPISIVLIACLIHVRFALPWRLACHFTGASEKRRQTPMRLESPSTSTSPLALPCTQTSFERDRESFSATIESVTTAAALLKLPQRVLCPLINSRTALSYFAEC